MPRTGLIRRVVRWGLTIICDFIYCHPVFFNFLNKILFWGQDVHWRKIALSKLPVGKKTLELGCGMFPTIDQGVLLDASIPLLKKAPAENRPKVSASSLALPFRAESFECALSVFPPGVGADNGFFQKGKFWEELSRILVKDGVYVAVLYIKYKGIISRFSSLLLDPLPTELWPRIKEMAPDFEIGSEEVTDQFGNKVVLAIAKKI